MRRKSSSHEDKTENVLEKLMIIKRAETAVAPGHVLRGTEDYEKTEKSIWKNSDPGGLQMSVIHRIS